MPWVHSDRNQQINKLRDKWERKSLVSRKITVNKCRKDDRNRNSPYDNCHRDGWFLESLIVTLNLLCGGLMRKNIHIISKYLSVKHLLYTRRKWDSMKEIPNRNHIISVKICQHFLHLMWWAQKNTLSIMLHFCQKCMCWVGTRVNVILWNYFKINYEWKPIKILLLTILLNSHVGTYFAIYVFVILRYLSH